MTMIYGGQVSLGLRAYFYLDGNPFDPDVVQYSIFDPDGLPMKGQIDKPAVREDEGDYRVDWTPAVHHREGQYRLVWDFKPMATDQLRSSTDEFTIIRDLSEGAQAIHIPSGHGMGTSPGGNGAGNVFNGLPFVIRDFWGRVKVFNV